MKLLDWDSLDEPNEKILWASKLDNRFQIEVQKLNSSIAKLNIYDRVDSFNEVYSEEVDVPSVVEYAVFDWREMVEDFIDFEYLPYEDDDLIY